MAGMSLESIPEMAGPAIGPEQIAARDEALQQIRKQG